MRREAMKAAFEMLSAEDKFHAQALSAALKSYKQQEAALLEQIKEVRRYAEEDRAELEQLLSEVLQGA